MHYRALRLLALPLLMAGFGAAHADDDDDDDERKEKYRDGHCKVEREWKKDGSYKEERKCKAPRHRQQQQPVVIVYPPWIVDHGGAPGYDPAQVPSVPQAGVSRCNSREVGQVLGGVVGAVVGNQVAKGERRVLASIGGAVAGVLLGGAIGREIDARDQACVGQVLEFTPVGRRVQWAGTQQGQLAVTPAQAVRRGDVHCRPYQLEWRTPHGVQRTQETACRRPDGVWVATRS